MAETEKTALLSVTKENFMVNVGFPLAKANIRGEEGGGAGGLAIYAESPALYTKDMCNVTHC